MAKKKNEVTSDYSGFLLAFEPLRTEKIEERLHAFGKAVESFSAMDWEFQRREVVLLALTAERRAISGAALMERMHGSGGTGKLKMLISEPVLFERPVKQEELRVDVTLSELVSTAENLRRVDPRNWSGLINDLASVRPEDAQALRDLFTMREMKPALLGDTPHIRRLVEQRDAVGLTLEIAGIKRSDVLDDIDVENIDEARSILDVLNHEPFHEQDIIRHDEKIFKQLLSKSMKHMRVEEGAGCAVNIHVYDKKPLETVLGIDLLIYMEVYRSFLLIQYKSMEHSGSSWSYSMDEQIKKQMTAMEVAEAAIGKRKSSQKTMWDWRLYPSPFYFKFCETTRSDAKEDALVRGILISHQHLRHFFELPQSEGPKGGRKIGYDNCPRYFNNTQFLDLAREGWIGCDEKGFNFIADVVEAGTRGGRSAMLAVITGEPPSDARQHGRRWH